MVPVTSLIRVVLAAAILGSSSLCWAGAHAGGAVMFRGGGGHGFARFSGAGAWHGGGAPHFSRAPMRGFAGQGSWGRPTVYGSRLGHVNTAYFGLNRPFARVGFFPRVIYHAGGYGWPRLGYGRRGFVRYALAPRFFGRYGAGAYPYGGTLGTGYGLGSGDAYGFAEPPLAATYAEPPLGPSPYGDNDGLSFDRYGTGYDGTSGYGGGPRIISVHSTDRLRPPVCSCAREGKQGPVVYRFGVGSYY